MIADTSSRKREYVDCVHYEMIRILQAIALGLPKRQAPPTSTRVGPRIKVHLPRPTNQSVETRKPRALFSPSPSLPSSRQVHTTCLGAAVELLLVDLILYGQRRRSRFLLRDDFFLCVRVRV